MKTRFLVGVAALALLIVALPGSRSLMAQAPESLSVLVNGFALQGKALWYKGRVYVPLEDVASSTGGSYDYDPHTRTARATIGSPQRVAPRESHRPYLKVVWERKYTSGSNAKVLATIANQGQAPAEDVEVICIFKDETLQDLTAQARNLGRLEPGQSRTVEFQLFEGVPDAPVAYDPYSPYLYNYNYNTNIAREGQVFVGGAWTRISYEFKFNYQ